MASSDREEFSVHQCQPHHTGLQEAYPFQDNKIQPHCSDKSACHQKSHMDVKFGAVTHLMLKLGHDMQCWHSSIGKFLEKTLDVRFTIRSDMLLQDVPANALTPFYGSALSSSGTTLLQRPITISIGTLCLHPTSLQSQECSQFGMVLIRKYVLRIAQLVSVCMT